MSVLPFQIVFKPDQRPFYQVLIEFFCCMGHQLTLATFIIDLGSVDPQISNLGPVIEKNSIAVIDEYDPMKGKRG